MAGLKVGKGKKSVPKFIAGAVDNTAPVNKIVDYIESQNPQAHAFYRHLIKQRIASKNYLSNFHHATPGHPLYAFDDDWDGDISEEYFENFDYKSLMPKIITPMKNVGLKDPVSYFLLKKMKWKSRFINFKCLPGHKQYENLNEDVLYGPKEFVSIAAHIESNPDIYFDSIYNWYYAGNGNLQLVCLDWVDYLLCSEFHKLYLHRFNKEKVEIDSECITSFDCGLNNYIFETICSTQNVVALRTKYKIFILKIEEDDNIIKFQKLSVLESKIPYTSVTFDTHHKNILYVVMLDGHLNIVNLDRMRSRTIKLKREKTSVVDNWSTIIGAERSYYTHVSRDHISTYDKRNNSVINTCKGLKNVTDEINCNLISAAKQIEGNPNMYFACNHHLFTIDVRMFSKSTKILQRWTHGMQCNPTYISICDFSVNKELICLSSQWCEDMCVISNYNSTASKSSGVTIPYRPPSIFNTLKEARENMLCCDIYNPIDLRLSTSITGNFIYEFGDKYNVLMQNSLGDISWHLLYPFHYEMFVHDDAISALHEWQKDHKVNKKVFEVSAVKNIGIIRRGLYKIPKEYPFMESADSVKRKSNFNEQEIIKAAENLEVDPGILELWTTENSGSLVNDKTNADDTVLHLQFSEESDAG